MFNIKPKVRPPMPSMILTNVRKEIKTIVEPYYDEFDEKVNAAIADGYKLTKRTVIVPHNEREKTFFYAELEKIARVMDEYQYRGFTIKEWADKILNDAPISDVEPVKRGKWLKGKDWDEWFCSACRKRAYLDWKENPILSYYCPHCGARNCIGRDRVDEECAELSTQKE